MKLMLKKAARIRHEAGEIVEVSPAEAGFLLSTGTAVRVAEAPAVCETPEAQPAEVPEKTAAKETPETAARPKKTTRTKK